MKLPHVCVAILIGCSPCSATIINGDAETGDLAPWQHTSGLTVTTAFQQQSGLVTPFAGQYFFSMAGQPGIEETLIQHGAFDTQQSGMIVLNGYVQTEHSDYAIGRLGLFDTGGKSVVDAYTSMLQSPPLTWMPFSIRTNIEVPVIGWFVEFYGRGGPRESETNVYFDEITLNPVPEPNTAAAILVATLFCCRFGIARSKYV